MTNDAMNAFAAALRWDEKMARGLGNPVAGRMGAEAGEIIATDAHKHGFKLSAEHIEKARRTARAERTLSDDELDAVAGGFIDFNLFFDPKPFSRNDWGRVMNAMFASQGKSGWIPPLSPQRH